MSSFPLQPYRAKNPTLSDQEIAENIAKESGYHVAIRYTNQFTDSDEPTDIGFAKTLHEVQGYLALRNAVVLYKSEHGALLLRDAM